MGKKYMYSQLVENNPAISFHAVVKRLNASLCQTLCMNGVMQKT